MAIRVKYSIIAGSINLLVCRVPIGTHQSATDNHRTAPSACMVLFISHPFGVTYRSPLMSIMNTPFLGAIFGGYLLDTLLIYITFTINADKVGSIF